MEGRRHHTTGAIAGNVHHGPCVGYVLPGGPFGRNVGGGGAKGGAVGATAAPTPARGDVCAVCVQIAPNAPKFPRIAHTCA